MSNVINSINESFNRKLKESCEPKRGSRAQIKEGEQLNEIAPIIAAAAPMLMQAAGTAIGGIAQGVGQAVANGAQQQMEELDANSVEDNKATNHRIGKQSGRQVGNKSTKRLQRNKANKASDNKSLTEGVAGCDVANPYNTGFVIGVEGSEKRASGYGLHVDVALKRILAFINGLTQKEKDNVWLGWREAEDDDVDPASLKNPMDAYEGDIIVSVYSPDEGDDRTLSNYPAAEQAIRKALNIGGIKEALTDHISFDLNSDVYNALANIAFKYNLKGIDIEEDDFARAFDHFTIRFFDDGGKEDMFGE